MQLPRHSLPRRAGQQALEAVDRSRRLVYKKSAIQSKWFCMKRLIGGLAIFWALLVGPSANAVATEIEYLQP